MKEAPQVNPEPEVDGYYYPDDYAGEPPIKDLDTIPILATYTTKFTGPGFDKNTPGSLKQLRWAIYQMLDYPGLGLTAARELKQEVEELFKEYTNS
jgi:hypothetical protein